MEERRRKFDIVQILGIFAAVGMLIGGQMYLAAKGQREREAWNAAQAEREKAEAAAKATAEKAGGGALKSGDGKVEAAPAAPVAAAPAADVEPPKAADVTVKSNQLELVFTAEGAALRSATLAAAVVNPADKTGKKGLEILSEIEAGKLTFALPQFEIGPPEPERKKERLVYDGASGSQKPLSKRIWKLDSDSGSFDANGQWIVRYSAALAGKYTVTKTFTVHKDRYYMDLDIGVANRSGAPASYSYMLYGPAGVLLDGTPGDPKGGAYVSIRAELAGREAPAPGQTAGSPDVQQIDPDTALKNEEKSGISKAHNLWGGVKNRFYMAMLISLDPQQLIRLTAVPIANKPNDPDLRLAEPNVGVRGTRRESNALEDGKTAGGDRYALYVGPANEEQLAEAEAQLKPGQPLDLYLAMQYCDIFGWRWNNVDRLARLMMWGFRRLYDLIGNYGLAVILLTLIIKLALHPLQRKMMISMNKMQKLQPELKKIQEKYKNQSTVEAQRKKQQESMDLMRKHGASPQAGCLPMFIQLPILSALYGIFNHAFEIRGATFLWVADLSQQDRLFPLPFWPGAFNLLPLIYAGLQVLMMRINPMPKSDDPQQQMQQQMMQFMPVMISVMCYALPAGLMLYFAASAVFGMIETWYIKKYLIKDTPPGAVAATATGKPPPPTVVLTKAK